ncbi:Transmembrane protein 184 [Sphaceloma murrayae]|uniref:Transmembrane protein 184 n=1 Tax=Sphaceloma murrayae TaxID=2082308 RepID=A0A2K1QLC5_9PEZI|nr:Transmembrane protein 184 [Sphaceloma murrayae]
MKACNTTLEDLYVSEEPLWEHGLTWHRLGLIISAAFGLVSVVVALLLIFQHATHYSKPSEQKHIIRILLMIPVYSTVSFLSFLNYRHAVYFEVLRDCYEAFAIASFFTLMCHYIAPDLHHQKEYFRQLRPINWFWGVFGMQKCTGGKSRGLLRIPRSGLTWFNVIWVSVFQYCLIRVLFTIVSVITQYFDRYCAESLSPEFAHIWVMVFEASSVTVAMFCLIQFYLQLKDDLAPHRPFLKVLCIKLVIFFSFWQTLVISFLSSGSGPLQPTSKLAYPDIKIGIPSTLLCIEMAIFSIMHLFAFPWKPYAIDKSASKQQFDPHDIEDPASPQSPTRPTKYLGGFLGIKAVADAFNPWDILKATARGLRWLFVGRRNRFQDTSYSSQMNAQGKALTTGGEADIVPMHAKVASTSSDQGGHNRDNSDTAALLSNAGPVSPTTSQPTDYRPHTETGVVHAAGHPNALNAPDLHHQTHPTPSSPSHIPYTHPPPPVIRISPADGRAPSSNALGETTMPAPGSYGGRDHGEDMYNTQGYFRPGQSGLDPYPDTGYHGRDSVDAGTIGMAYGGHPGEEGTGMRHYGDRY